MIRNINDLKQCFSKRGPGGTIGGPKKAGGEMIKIMQK